MMQHQEYFLVFPVDFRWYLHSKLVKDLKKKGSYLCLATL